MTEQKPPGRINRLFRRAALILGYPILVTLLLGVLGLTLRYVQIELSSPPVSKEHLAYKQTYLENVKPAPKSAPNIIVIFFDDLGWGDLSSYGNKLIDTPHIDQVASEGLLMTDFYSASPVCTPSRAALLTGRYPPRTRTDRHVYFPEDSAIGKVRRMLGWANALPKEELTFAEVLGQAGYRTGMIGKWHLGDSEGYRPNDFGFQSWYGVLFSNDMFPLNLYQDEIVVIKDERIGTFFADERDEVNPLEGKGIDQTELTQLYTNQAVKFLKEKSDKPFLLYLAHSFPHVPHYPSPDHANQSDGGVYGDVVEDLDRSTGQIMAALKRLNLDDDTIVIITSDNGADYNGSPGALRGRKGDTWEGGQRVPLIVRWPNQIAPGGVSSEMAMNTDIFPTLLKLAGQDLPDDRHIDGKDIAPLLMGKAKSPHDYVYYFPTLDSLPGAVRDDRFKLTWKTGDSGRNRSHFSLLGADAENHEVRNLFPNKAEHLEKRLAAKREEIKKSPRGWL